MNDDRVYKAMSFLDMALPWRGQQDLVNHHSTTLTT